MIHGHSSDVMNAQRDEAFERFVSTGFPSKKVERYKYTDIQKLFAPDYGLNLNRLEIPVDPYQAFRCDVPNLSTSLYFVVNDRPLLTSPNGEGKFAMKSKLPEGVIVGNLSSPIGEVGKDLYNQLADNGDAITALNTMLAQDGLFVYVPKNVKVDRAIQVINILRSGLLGSMFHKHTASKGASGLVVEHIFIEFVTRTVRGTMGDKRIVVHMLLLVSNDTAIALALGTLTRKCQIELVACNAVVQCDNIVVDTTISLLVDIHIARAYIFIMCLLQAIEVKRSILTHKGLDDLRGQEAAVAGGVVAEEHLQLGAFFEDDENAAVDHKSLSPHPPP